MWAFYPVRNSPDSVWKIQGEKLVWFLAFLREETCRKYFPGGGSSRCDGWHVHRTYVPVSLCILRNARLAGKCSWESAMKNSADSSKSISDRFHRHVQLLRRRCWREGLRLWKLQDHPLNRGAMPDLEEDVLRLFGGAQMYNCGVPMAKFIVAAGGLSRDFGVLQPNRFLPVQLHCDSHPCPIHPSIPAAPSTVQKPPPHGMLRLSMTRAVLFHLFSLLSSIPLRFPPSFIIQWPRPLLGAGSSKDGRGEDRANWQDKLLARKPPRSCSPCTEPLGTRTPAETDPPPGASRGRWLPPQGPKVAGRDSDAALNSPTSRRASKGKTKGWGDGRDSQRHPGSVLNQQRFLGPFSFPKRLSHNIPALVVRNLLVTTRFHWLTFSSFALNFALLDLSRLPLRWMCRRQLCPISAPISVD